MQTSYTSLVNSFLPQISLDEFGELPSTRKVLTRRAATRARDGAITCSRQDCVHPLHMHNRDTERKRIDISDNDSDLLLSMSEHDQRPRQEDKKSERKVDAESHDREVKTVRVTTARNRISPSPSIVDENTHRVSSDTETTGSFSPNSGNIDSYRTPVIGRHSSSFRRVGVSQCKPGKTVRRTRNIENSDPIPYPEPMYVEKENLQRRVVFESPNTPAGKLLCNKRTLNVLETPESGKGRVLVDDTPEHLVGLRMVTRRLRRVLNQNSVPDSLIQ